MNTDKNLGLILAGQARFTVITPSLLRLEFASDGRFCDERTMFAENREQRCSDFQAHESAGCVTLATSRLRLTWQVSDRGFTEETLAIESADEGGFAWKPGQA